MWYIKDHNIFYNTSFFIKFYYYFKNSIISSVIVDSIQDHTSVVVDSNGFHPNIINVEIVSLRIF